MNAISHQVLPADDWQSADFWRAFAPELHLADPQYQRSVGRFVVGDTDAEALRLQTRIEGYVERRPREWRVPISTMAALVARLAQSGIPAPFAFVYDEFWLLFRQCDAMISAVLGNGYQRLPDFWAWHVDPAGGEAGWRPHRDKDYLSLHADGSPRSLSVWVNLTDSTPLNGCMYLLPADRDPTYGTPDDHQWQIDHADIRALPAAAGTVFFWTQALLHWGSRSSPRARHPRISIAMEFQDAVSDPFNTPLCDPCSVPSFARRLCLIGKQLVQYEHMYPLRDDLRALAIRLLKDETED